LTTVVVLFFDGAKVEVVGHTTEVVGYSGPEDVELFSGELEDEGQGVV
jgi:hypothetical protein